ncbi:MAG: 4-(cytidine 5'-diphospho)-2-C-methyl-D-erythritol kinase [Thiohalomonadaceae bacterium]
MVVDHPWPAPAKLNLFLHVVGRRADGYHLLQSVFQFLDHCDLIHFSVHDRDEVRRVSVLPGVAPAQDLVVRAAQLLRQECGYRGGVDIRMDKHLPMGGGLGGGSSDAATTLVALNHLWQLNLSLDALAALGLRLGADVPVFVRGQAAWAEGVGERLAPVVLPEPWFVVLVPPVSVSTAEVFTDPQLTRNCTPITIRDFLHGAGGNVCESVVRRRHPQVAAALDWLATRAPARMTGTGACVFAAFENEFAARATLAARPAGLDGFVARGLNRSPLLARLESCES